MCEPPGSGGSDPPEDNRAPSPFALPPRRAGPAYLTGGMDKVDEFFLRAIDTLESEEEDSQEDVDSDGSPFRAADSTDSEEVDRDILWMPEGDMARTHKIAYAFINEDGPLLSLTPFIQSAIFSVAPGCHFHMFPSSQGQMMLLFDFRGERDFVVDTFPISIGDA